MQLDPQRMKLSLDTNVWINYFLKEEPNYRDCAKLLETAIAVEANLFVAPTTLKDVFYLIPRCLRRQDVREGRADEASYAPAAWACVDFMLDIATPTPLSLAECSMARMLRTRFGDFEDNLLLATNETAQVDYIVTYDRPLLKQFPEVFVTPRRALELLGANSDKPHP